MINCGETIFSVISGFWIVTGWRHIWSWRVHLIDPPNFWVSYRWPAGCIKREKNVINIAKPCIHKAAGSGINENFQSSFGDTCCLLFMYCLLFIVCTVYRKPIYSNLALLYANLFLFAPKILKLMYSCRPFPPLHIAFCQLSVLGFHCFLQHTT